jgi:hypothetical protein
MAKNRLEKNVNFFGSLLKTIAESEFGIDVSQPSGLVKFNQHKDEIFRRAFELGTVTAIYSDYNFLNSDGFDSLVAEKDEEAYNHYIMFGPHMENPQIKAAKKALSCYTNFLEKGVLGLISSINKEELLSHHIRSQAAPTK